MSYHLKKHLFTAGELLISDSIKSRGIKHLPLLHRHLSGDWGDVDQYTSDCNDQSLNEGAEILSQYSSLDSGLTEELVTIVTAADRAYTVIFLSSDPS